MSQESNDFRLFKELWALLDGEKTGGVAVENLLYLLLLIRGAKLPAREVAFEAEPTRDTPLLRLGQIVNDSFTVKPGAQKTIFTHFKDLYVNRMQFEGLKKPVKSVEVDITVAHKVSKKSSKIAEKHREKIAPGMSLDIVDFLLKKHEVKESIKVAKGQAIKDAKHEHEYREVTFKPKTNDFEHQLEQYKPQSGDRALDLNNKVRKGQYALKHNKDHEEYEYDKSYQECTHKPVINQFSEVNPCVWRLQNDNEIKGLDKFI